jgi:uncharacterized protein
MGFIRFLLLVLAGAILWRLIKQFQNDKLSEPKKESIPQTPPQKNDGIMVRCHYCGLHLPENEALRVGKVWYCCDAHQSASQNE